jgi:hypothetical protein
MVGHGAKFKRKKREAIEALLRFASVEDAIFFNAIVTDPPCGMEPDREWRNRAGLSGCGTSAGVGRW